MKTLCHTICNILSHIIHGCSYATHKELQRIDDAMIKVRTRMAFLEHDFYKNEKQLFACLGTYERLIAYKEKLLNVNNYTPRLSGAGNEELVDEVLDYRW